MIDNKKQSGAALITALICLILVSLMGVMAMRTAGTSAKIAANSKQSAQALRMAESGLSAFFISPAEVWNVQTVSNTIHEFSATVGATTVPLQAEYTHDSVCGIEFGEDRVGVGGGKQCLSFRITSNYEVNALTEATASAGFLSDITAAN